MRVGLNRLAHPAWAATSQRWQTAASLHTCCGAGEAGGQGAAAAGERCDAAISAPTAWFQCADAVDAAGKRRLNTQWHLLSSSDGRCNNTHCAQMLLCLNVSSGLLGPFESPDQVADAQQQAGGPALPQVEELVTQETVAAAAGRVRRCTDGRQAGRAASDSSRHLSCCAAVGACPPAACQAVPRPAYRLCT